MGNSRLADWKIGLIAIALTVLGFYLAFAKSIPFTGDGYTLKAVVQDAQGIRAKAPVRVAGVNVGEVITAEHLTDENGDGVDAAVITMKLNDDARPIHDDATLQLRPRLFLEGNLFVDLKTGTPGGE
jgi:ABC-type transporter Mla subunit MlaD